MLTISGHGSIEGKSDNGLYYINQKVERLNSVEDGYIRFDSGVQICHMNTYTTGNSSKFFTFAQPFILPPTIAITADWSGSAANTSFSTWGYGSSKTGVYVAAGFADGDIRAYFCELPLT